jgi:hypothetical protein
LAPFIFEPARATTNLVVYCRQALSNELNAKKNAYKLDLK